MRRFYLALSIAAACALATPSRATRIVLAPGGLVANPSSVAVEYAGRATAARDWLGWVRIGVPQSDLGVEVELERYELRGERGTSLSAQYSIDRIRTRYSAGRACSDMPARRSPPPASGWCSYRRTNLRCRSAEVACRSSVDLQGLLRRAKDGDI